MQLRFADFRMPDLSRGSAEQRLNVTGHEGESLVAVETVIRKVETPMPGAGRPMTLFLDEPWVRVWWTSGTDVES